MQGMRYLEEAVTLEFDAEKCNGCRACTLVCPHGVFEMRDKRAVMVDRGACMECGACALNCEPGAITVKPGVGCAEAIIHSWIYGGEPSCGCPTEPGSDGVSGGCCGSAPEAAPVPTTGGCCSGSPEQTPAPATGSCCSSAPEPADAATGCCSPTRASAKSDSGCCGGDSKPGGSCR